MRRHEFALRAALGAGRGRILQQCLTESLLLVCRLALAAMIAYDSTSAFGRFLTPAGSVQATVLRQPEFGVRIAVGATRGHLLKIVLGDALRMVAIGSACGLVLAGIGYVFIRRFLYGASTADIRIALASLAVLIAVALIAAAIPARRAASLDPTQALRAE